MKFPSATPVVVGIILLVGFFALVFFESQRELAAEVSQLRAELATLRNANPARPTDDAANAPMHAGAAPDYAARDHAKASDRRIAELEDVVNAQADLLEELYGKLSGVELTQQKAAAPAWSAMQAVGAPDSAAGDQRTAWASATADGGEEWLLVDFARAVQPATIIVRENCAPGAITRIAAVSETGNEILVWQGEAPQLGAVSDTPFPAMRPIMTSKVKIYLDTSKVAGWNEIDAVQVIGRDGTRQWATGASASSSYGAPGAGLDFGSTQ